MFVYEHATDTLRVNKDSGYTEQEAKDIAHEVWKLIDADAKKLPETYIVPVEKPSFSVTDGDVYPR